MTRLACLLLLACGGKSPGDTGSPADSDPSDTDTDADTDADADADADTDADTDTVVHVDRTCEDASTLPIPEAEFEALYTEKLCFYYQSCNPDIDCDGWKDSMAGCTYTGTDACLCLDATFVCNDEFGPGFEYVEFAPACQSVYTCPN